MQGCMHSISAAATREVIKLTRAAVFKSCHFLVKYHWRTDLHISSDGSSVERASNPHPLGGNEMTYWSSYMDHPVGWSQRAKWCSFCHNLLVSVLVCRTRRIDLPSIENHWKHFFFGKDDKSQLVLSVKCQKIHKIVIVLQSLFFFSNIYINCEQKRETWVRNYTYNRGRREWSGFMQVFSARFTCGRAFLVLRMPVHIPAQDQWQFLHSFSKAPASKRNLPKQRILHNLIWRSNIGFFSACYERLPDRAKSVSHFGVE